MGLIKGMFKLGGALVAGSVIVTGSAIIGTGAFVAGAVEAIIDSNNEPGTAASINTKYNNKLNSYSNVKEYVAQSIANYCNGTLPKDTAMYKELDIILSCISWDSIDE